MNYNVNRIVYNYNLFFHLYLLIHSINDLIVDGPLQLTDGNNVQDFVAFDDDGGIFGDVTFSITDADTGSK